MARKRGFFAEIHHQSQLADKRNRQASAAAARANAAAARAAEQARRHAEVAQAQMIRANTAEQKRAAQEAQRLHDEAMQGEATARNAELARIEGELKSLLNAGLATDPFVDLEGLRQIAHPPTFARADLESPLPPPVPLPVPEEPRYEEPPSPTGYGALFGGKKKHAEAVSAAQAEYARSHSTWQSEIAELPGAQLRQMQDHQRAEEQRRAELGQARAQYEAEVARQAAEISSANAALDHLIKGLQSGETDAINEYVSVVFSNSVYPESFAVEHEAGYDASARELSLAVVVPQPSDVSNEKEFRYLKAKGEVSPTLLSPKEQRDRYSEAICQVALRSLHEVFAADRAGHIETVALSIETAGIDHATGLMKRTKLIAVAAERSTFLQFDLTKVVPLATLQHLNALVSKNPFELVGVDQSKGVRG